MCVRASVRSSANANAVRTNASVNVALQMSATFHVSQTMRAIVSVDATRAGNVALQMSATFCARMITRATANANAVRANASINVALIVSATANAVRASARINVALQVSATARVRISNRASASVRVALRMSATARVLISMHASANVALQTRACVIANVALWLSAAVRVRVAVREIASASVPRVRACVLAAVQAVHSPKPLDVHTSRDTKCRGPPHNPSRRRWSRERRIANTPHPCPRMPHHACWMCIHRR